MSARPHFSIARIPVRVEPAFLLVSTLFGLRYLQDGLDIVLIWVACSFISILVHELGHGFALKVFGQPSVIVLHGFGGVTISQRRRSLARSRSIIVSVAGSLTGLILLWLPSRTYLDSLTFERAVDLPRFVLVALVFLAFQNLWWSVANLLPVRPLDGGNVSTEIFGLDRARKLSIAFAIAAAVYAFVSDQTYGGFFFLFIAFMNFQEMRAAQVGGDMDAFHVDAPDTPDQPGRRAQARSQANLSVVGGAAPLEIPDATRAQQLAWAALKNGDVPAARRLTRGLGSGVDPFLKAATALASGDKQAFKLFEDAYVAVPGGPSNLIATEVLARTGAAVAVARRLVERPDGKGREGAGSLQTHLHYADCFAEAAEVGTVVYAADPPSKAQTAFEVACSWAKATDVDHAVEWLERAADDGFRAASLVDGEPDLEAVRADPRWPLLRARLA
ncbi:MAG: TPR end-of-group domain-containing protein [Acidimicrobiales bacterium]